jgi:hypothetical protein
MKEIPDVFQFRHADYTNYTHTAQLNRYGDYEVKWARGWANVVGFVPHVVFDSNEVNWLVEDGLWLLVDDNPKQKDKLPDEFYFTNSLDERFKAVRGKLYWTLTCQEGGRSLSVTEEQVKCSLKHSWKILPKPVLTAEQQRQLKEFKEQIFQLDNSIRIQEQTIEHHNRLVANYKSRQDDLRKKIEEMEGV